ncbi:hypothetical protein BVRB_6g148250 [Beta vulgaris subsp. vulgaris]|nr:hypothetical protein BVRB_6g148250 [Beta vulgaris subsp. vulgaris]
MVVRNLPTFNSLTPRSGCVSITSYWTAELKTIFVRSIGGTVGKVLEVEFSGVSWDKSVRVKVLLEVLKPLRIIIKLRNTKGTIVIVEVKYERLPTFCYTCGCLGHIEHDCSRVHEDDREVEKQWSTWLRAFPRRCRLQMNEEAKKFLQSAKTLVFDKRVEDEEITVGDPNGVENGV